MATAVEMKTEAAHIIPGLLGKFEMTHNKPVLQNILLKNFKLGAGQEKRLMPHLDVKAWDRLHFHIGRDAKSIAGLEVRILFATPIEGMHCGGLLADSTVWFEEGVTEREFKYTLPKTYNGTGFVMSVPVVAPQLYDVILKNTGPNDLDTLYVAVMSQEI